MIVLYDIVDDADLWCLLPLEQLSFWKHDCLPFSTKLAWLVYSPVNVYEFLRQTLGDEKVKQLILAWSQSEYEVCNINDNQGLM